MVLFFFFKQKTAYEMRISDWSSDVCSSDLNWTGLRGLEQEDAAMALSCGPIVDRSEENLVAADIAVVRVRRRLLAAVKMVKDGEPALGAFLSDLTEIGRASCRERVCQYV